MTTLLLRQAQASDALAVARVHVRSWQVAYRKLLPDEYLDGLRPEDRAARYTFGSADPTLPMTIVASEEGSIRGFATTAPGHDVNAPGMGELCALYVDPEWWGRGIGVALIKAARNQLVEQGFREAVLWLLVANARAQRFYEADGWRIDGEQRTHDVWGIALPEIRMRRSLRAA